MNRIFQRGDWLYALVVLIAVVWMSFSVAHYYAYFIPGEVTSDYPAFMHFTVALDQGKLSEIPAYHIAHMAWEILSVAIHRLLGISLRTTSFLLTLGSIAAAAVITYFWFARSLRDRELPVWWAMVAAIGLSVATPLSVLAPVDRRWYQGYIGITSYHNPTIILLRPLAILQFILVPACFQDRAITWKRIGLAAAVTLLATFSKPSYAICLLPAICGIAAYRWYKQQTIQWRLLLAGFVIPTFLLLSWQFLVAYRSPEQGSIFFYPFGVMTGLSGFVGVKFLLSILFPLLAAMLFFPEAVRDMRMILAWIGFAIGAFYSYFVADGPPRTFDADWIWSGKITLLLLFCVSTIFVLERIRTVRWKATLSSTVWTAHASFGLAYIVHILTTYKRV